MTRECEKCGNTFSIHVSQTKRPGNGRYCSQSCARSGSPTRKKGSPLVECFTCGATFHKFKSEVAKNVGDKHFCSPACWYSFNQRDNHYLWAGGQDGRMSPEGRTWRKAVVTRDRGHCRICLSTDRIEAHHILSFTKQPDFRWDVTNGITLCRSCHDQIHRQQERHPEDVELLRFMATVPLEAWHEAGPEQAGDPASPS